MSTNDSQITWVTTEKLDSEGAECGDSLQGQKRSRLDLTCSINNILAQSEIIIIESINVHFRVREENAEETLGYHKPNG
jgi:hypothetical protein